jgi:phage terminase large subunit-like protein
VSGYVNIALLITLAFVTSVQFGPLVGIGAVCATYLLMPYSPGDQ